MLKVRNSTFEKNITEMPAAKKQEKTKLLLENISLKAKPFLKWAGGKGQLLNTFHDLYPAALKEKKIVTYIEPFLGSGAVFFDIAQKYGIKQAFLYDINEELILVYKVVQRDAARLIEFLFRYQKIYWPLNTEKRSAYFYEQRANYNTQRFNIDYTTYSDTWIPRAAQFIFLNRTCFNGLYRVNAQGAFNTPIGRYELPNICDEYNLLVTSKLLEIATLQKADFRQLKKETSKGSFIYLDPPYRPLNKTAHFKAYSKHEFNDSTQLELAQLFHQLDKKGALLMLSNSDPRNHNPADDFFDEAYKNYRIIRVPAKRLINSKPEKRGLVNELVIRNYET
jgi:DNA adenine methylase